MSFSCFFFAFFLVLCAVLSVYCQYSSFITVSLLAPFERICLQSAFMHNACSQFCIFKSRLNITRITKKTNNSIEYRILHASFHCTDAMSWKWIWPDIFPLSMHNCFVFMWIEFENKNTSFHASLRRVNSNPFLKFNPFRSALCTTDSSRWNFLQNKFERLWEPDTCPSRCQVS